MSLEFGDVVKVVICISFTLTCQLSYSQSARSKADGNWANTATWDCSCIPNSTYDVEINHTVTINASAGNRSAHTVKIEPQSTAAAILNISGGVTFNAESVSIYGINNGAAELNVSGTGTTINLTELELERDQTSDARVRFRLTNTSVANISASMYVRYMDGSDNTESHNEVSIGSAAGDAAILRAGAIRMHMESNSNGNNSLLVANSSIVEVAGDFVIENSSSSASGVQALILNDNAQVSIDGQLMLLYNDVTPQVNDQNTVSLNSSSNSGSAKLTIGSLRMQTLNSTSTINNYFKLFSNSSLTINGDIGLEASHPTAASVDNRVEVNGNATVEIKGEIINPLQGSFEFLGTSTILFTGADYQNLPRLKINTSFINLTINNSSGLPLPLCFNSALSGNLTLVNGVIASTASAIFSFNDGATTTPGNDSSYISGPVKKQGGTINNGIILPLGSGSRWAPIAFTNISGATASTSLIVEFFNSTYSNVTTDGTFAEINSSEYWKIDAIGPVPVADVRFFWKNACSSSIYDVSTGADQTLFLGKFDSDTNRWNYFTTTTIDSGSLDCEDGGTLDGSLTQDELSCTGLFTFAYKVATALPVQLETFFVKDNGEGAASVSWITSFEDNNYYFLLQKSADGITFQTIDSVAARGDRVSRTTYKSVDSNPFYGHNYYRLKQVDIDGDYVISNVIHYLGVNEIDFEFFPNPVNIGNKIFLKCPLDEARISIFDPHGRLASTFTIRERGIVSFPFQFHSYGCHVLQVSSIQGIKNYKIIVR
jgi:hypothetical protein